MERKKAMAITQKYANMHLVTESYPYEIVRVISDNIIEVREMDAKLDGNWKPEIIPGGFAGHCTNQHSQHGHWVFTSNPAYPVSRVHRRKNRRCGKGGYHVLADKPCRFYDYNF